MDQRIYRGRDDRHVAGVCPAQCSDVDCRSRAALRRHASGIAGMDRERNGDHGGCNTDECADCWVGGWCGSRVCWGHGGGVLVEEEGANGS